jgi:ATP-binding cassette, subfamily B, bacterial
LASTLAAGTRPHSLTGKIGLLIGHRLDGIRRADLIVVLRDGSIAEQGSHDALMRGDEATATTHACSARRHRASWTR